MDYLGVIVDEQASIASLLFCEEAQLGGKKQFPHFRVQKNPGDGTKILRNPASKIIMAPTTPASLEVLFFMNFLGCESFYPGAPFKMGKVDS